ncbi:MAG: hypothetical protein HYT80_02825 [Euryarchaeota archaeon]|nr:hypothetical protein [Euryarchaeota archaeon]
MDVEGFRKRVEDFLGDVREALAVVEEAAQADDDDAWLDLSRAYALMVAPLRDYLAGHERGRPLPKQLGKRLGDLRAAFVAHADHIATLALHPDLAEIDALRRDAESVS